MPDKETLLYSAIGAAMMTALLMVPVPVPIAEYDVSARIVEEPRGNMTLGLVLDETAVQFGQVPRETVQAKKAVNIQHRGTGTIWLQATTDGEIAPYLQARPRHIAVSPGSNTTITLTLLPAEDMRTGIWTGTLSVTRYMPWYEAIL